MYCIVLCNIDRNMLRERERSRARKMSNRIRKRLKIRMPWKKREKVFITIGPFYGEWGSKKFMATKNKIWYTFGEWCLRIARAIRQDIVLEKKGKDNKESCGLAKK